MFRVTIEDDYSKSTVECAGEMLTVEEATEMCYRAMIANGYSPENVASQFSERGEEELAALEK